jgi:hypothetical protein
LLDSYDISELLFSKPSELQEMLRKRESLAARHCLKLSEVAADLERKLSPVEISKKLLSKI